MHAQTLQKKGTEYQVLVVYGRESLGRIADSQKNLRAINHISQTAEYLGSFWKFFTADYHGNNRENACNLLEAEHETLKELNK